MKTDDRKILIAVRSVFLTMVLCLSTACSAFKEFSFLKSKNSNKETVTHQSSGHTRLIDYSEIMQRDSSSFAAWLFVDGDFSFHQDSGIRGDKALVQFVGKRKTVLQLKDSLILQQDTSNLMEHTADQSSVLKRKDKKTRGRSWVVWIAGLLFLWFLVRKYKIHSVF